MNTQPNLITKIEALLFVVGEDGLSDKQLMQFTMATPAEIEVALVALQASYEDETRAIELRQTAGVYRLVTKQSVASVVEKLIEDPPLQSLSQAALEVLAIVAYKQPVTRSDIEFIRGVKSERPLNTLAAKGLVTEVGRNEGAGRAILYGTTTEFLHQFALNDITELPALPDEEEVSDEATDLFMSKFEQTFDEN
ncbi:Segregation and condensation protein B [Metalysinibacillus saudimassiliensis]|uniref:Segregation and condensation protein B n=1 Tax=Metalysinibacillus saudimassiliensis TaxID=1461583 RepID=A0A078MJ43_9BACL|nr:Segregation and condensation protein B [Metalysinibacillus saudimassiliensis]